MGCGCAKRMRTHVLPLAGYEFSETKNSWIKGDEVIPDSQVEKHHTKLVLQNSELFDAATIAAANAVRNKAKELSTLLGNGRKET